MTLRIIKNSNITYRVYDYGRRDKNGNERELHVAKAIEVTSLNALEPKELNIEVKDGLLKGINKFFTVTYVDVDGDKEFTGDKKSFRCFTCLDGEGMIGDMPIKKGESVFVPATLGDFVVTGNFTAIITTIRKYYLKKRHNRK